MGVRSWIEGWPVYRQFTGDDPLGRGAAARSERSKTLTARTETAERVARSCARTARLVAGSGCT
jgi:formate dehydrogenase major subunit